MASLRARSRDGAVATFSGHVRADKAEGGAVTTLELEHYPGATEAALTRLALGRELERYDRSIDVHVSRLRHKLAEASTQAPRIDAVRGAGYVLVAPP